MRLGIEVASLGNGQSGSEPLAMEEAIRRTHEQDVSSSLDGSIDQLGDLPRLRDSMRSFGSLPLPSRSVHMAIHHLDLLLARFPTSAELDGHRDGDAAD